MKNIFIEGIQGMGKSTLVNAILAEIPGYHVCREGDYSPVELAWCTWMSEEEYQQVLSRYEPLREEIIKSTVREGSHYIVTYTKILTDIPGFHKDLENFEIYNGRKTLQELEETVLSRYEKFSGNGFLFECSFFQNVIEDLILFHQLNDEEIMGFYKKLFGKIKQEDFLLFYLYSDKVEECIKVIKEERCDDQGNEMWFSLMSEYLNDSPLGIRQGYKSFEDMIGHFRHRQKLELRIIKEIVGERGVVLPAKEWKMGEVLAFL